MSAVHPWELRVVGPDLAFSIDEVVASHPRHGMLVLQYDLGLFACVAPGATVLLDSCCGVPAMQHVDVPDSGVDSVLLQGLCTIFLCMLRQ
jgi:hypothetical protein